MKRLLLSFGVAAVAAASAQASFFGSYANTYAYNSVSIDTIGPDLTISIVNGAFGPTANYVGDASSYAQADHSNGFDIASGSANSGTTGSSSSFVESYTIYTITNNGAGYESLHFSLTSHVEGNASSSGTLYSNAMLHDYAGFHDDTFGGYFGLLDFGLLQTSSLNPITFDTTLDSSLVTSLPPGFTWTYSSIAYSYQASSTVAAPSPAAILPFLGGLVPMIRRRKRA